MTHPPKLDEATFERANAAYASAGANAGTSAADFKHLPALRAACAVVFEAGRLEGVREERELAAKLARACDCEHGDGADSCPDCCGPRIARKIQEAP